MKTLKIMALLLIASITFGYAVSPDKFLVKGKHTKEQCLATLVEMKDKPALLSKFDWGCGDGDHSGYGIIEAKSAEEVRQMLPKEMRESVEIVKVTKFTPAQIEKYHQGK